MNNWCRSYKRIYDAFTRAFNFNELLEYPHDRLMDQWLSLYFRVDTVESQGKLSGEDMAAATGQKRRQSIGENEQFERPSLRLLDTGMI